MKLELDDYSVATFSDDEKPEDMSWTDWRKLKRENELGVREKKPKRERGFSEVIEDSPLGKFKRKVLGVNTASDLVPSKSTTGICCCCLGTGGCFILIVVILLLLAAAGFALSHKSLFLL